MCVWLVIVDELRYERKARVSVDHSTHKSSFQGQIFQANHLAVAQTNQTYNTQDKHKKPQTNAGLVTSYDILSGNGLDLFLQKNTAFRVCSAWGIVIAAVVVLVAVVADLSSSYL